MPLILEAEAVRFDSQVLFRRKCDSCGEHYFFDDDKKLEKLPGRRWRVVCTEVLGK